MDTRLLLCLTTTADMTTAEALARKLLDARRCACVSLIPGIRSLYWWQGKLESAGEVILMIKTMANAREAVEKLIKENHPYETPELLWLNPEHVDERYLAWAAGTVG